MPIPPTPHHRSNPPTARVSVHASLLISIPPHQKQRQVCISHLSREGNTIRESNSSDEFQNLPYQVLISSNRTSHITSRFHTATMGFIVRSFVFAGRIFFKRDSLAAIRSRKTYVPSIRGSRHHCATGRYVCRVLKRRRGRGALEAGLKFPRPCIPCARERGRSVGYLLTYVHTRACDSGPGRCANE